VRKIPNPDFIWIFLEFLSDCLSDCLSWGTLLVRYRLPVHYRMRGHGSCGGDGMTVRVIGVLPGGI
jgi:hypothetical protein